MARYRGGVKLFAKRKIRGLYYRRGLQEADLPPVNSSVPSIKSEYPIYLSYLL